MKSFARALVLEVPSLHRPQVQAQVQAPGEMAAMVVLQAKALPRQHFQVATALDQDLAATGAQVLAKALPNSQVAVVDPAAIARLNRLSPKPILCKSP